MDGFLVAEQRRSGTGGALANRPARDALWPHRRAESVPQFRPRARPLGRPVWQNRGGHRLWAAPESPASKALDNGPVEIDGEIEGDLRLAIRQPVEPESGLEKEIEIRMAHEGTDVTVLHRITNRNRGVVRLAPWGLSVMRPGGVAA